MAANHLSKNARQELGRATQAKLRARIAEGSLPQDYYRQLGRRGFKVTLLRYGPDRLAQVLSDYYGRAIEARVLQESAARRERAATRRAYPLDGQACVRCGEPAACRDHCGPHGWRDGHGEGFVQLLCRRCHGLVGVERARAG